MEAEGGWGLAPARGLPLYTYNHSFEGAGATTIGIHSNWGDLCFKHLGLLHIFRGYDQIVGRADRARLYYYMPCDPDLRAKGQRKPLGAGAWPFLFHVTLISMRAHALLG
jgi:hypothetical protein